MFIWELLNIFIINHKLCITVIHLNKNNFAIRNYIILFLKQFKLLCKNTLIMKIIFKLWKRIFKVKAKAKLNKLKINKTLKKKLMKLRKLKRSRKSSMIMTNKLKLLTMNKKVKLVLVIFKKLKLKINMLKIQLKIQLY